MEITRDNFEKVREAFGRFHNALRMRDSANSRFDIAAIALSNMRNGPIFTDDDFLMAGNLVAKKRRADRANFKACAIISSIKDSLTNP